MVTSIYTATGMTCQHCVASVTKEITRIDHVTAVSVDLPTGTITVTSDAPVPAAEVIAAIDAAGYPAVPTFSTQAQ
jgi:copper chaperone CopZ